MLGKSDFQKLGLTKLHLAYKAKDGWYWQNIKVSLEKKTILQDRVSAALEALHSQRSNNAKHTAALKKAGKLALNAGSFKTALRKLGFSLRDDRSSLSSSKYIILDNVKFAGKEYDEYTEFETVTFRMSNHELPEKYDDYYGYEYGMNMFDVGNQPFAHFVTFEQALEYVKNNFTAGDITVYDE
jgi:hypothetical protein